MDYLRHQAQGSTASWFTERNRNFFGFNGSKILEKATIHHQALHLFQQKCSVEAIIILSILSVKWKGKSLTVSDLFQKFIFTKIILRLQSDRHVDERVRMGSVQSITSDTTEQSDISRNNNSQGFTVRITDQVDRYCSLSLIFDLSVDP